MKSVKKGFTLIELLVVVAIIAILAAIAIPQFAKYRENAAKASAVADAKNIATAIESYYADTQSFPSSISDGSIVPLGTQTFSLSKNNSFKGYYYNNPSYTFVVSNTAFNKSVTFNSGTGGVDVNVWK